MNLLVFLNSCPDEFEILEIIYFARLLFNAIFIIVPIGLIIFIIIDLFKNVASDNEKDQKKNNGIIIKRIIYAILLFFVPTIVGVVNNLLGDLEVNYATYLNCANKEDIQDIIENKADHLVNLALNTLDYDDYSDASYVVSKIRDDNLRNKYEKMLEDIKNDVVKNNSNDDSDEDKGNNSNNDDDNNNDGNDDSGSDNDNDDYNENIGTGSIDVSYSDAVVENLASFIGSEAGGHKEGFLTQLFTGAVWINNFYDKIHDSNGKVKEINPDTMCELYSYASLYSSLYCYFTFDKLESMRGTVPEEHQRQLTIVAKILLSKNFTIPSEVRYQAADWIITQSNGTIWATTYTGLPGYYGHFGYSNYHAPLDPYDVYGNTVSINSDDYQNIADKLYEKYVK